MRVILAGGGTAGHINPAIAIADTVKKHNPQSEILFVGTSGGMEHTLVPKAGYEIEYINVSGFKRKISLENAASFAKACGAVVKCRKIIRSFSPDVVIGTGGYVSGPLLFAASMMGIPTLIHEQNVFAGMTSKMLSSRVNTVCISFEKSRERFEKSDNVVLTGNPVRENLFGISQSDAKAALGIDEKPLVVAFGGSLGAKRLNDVMTEYIKSLSDKEVNLLFATGERGYESVSASLGEFSDSRVKVVKYIYNMDEAMQAADLLICRAGAITLSELNALGKPSVLIPSPNVTDNHQYYNAKALCDNGAALMIEEKDLDNARFIREVDGLLADKKRLGEMAEKSRNMGITNATELIYGEILKILKEKSFV